MFSKGEIITILKSKTVTEVCLGILTGREVLSIYLFDREPLFL